MDCDKLNDDMESVITVRVYQAVFNTVIAVVDNHMLHHISVGAYVEPLLCMAHLRQTIAEGCCYDIH